MPWYDVFVPKDNWEIGDWASFVSIIVIICGFSYWVYKSIRSWGDTLHPVLKFEVFIDGNLEEWRSFVNLKNIKNELPRWANLYPYVVTGSEIKRIENKIKKDLDFSEDNLSYRPLIIFGSKSKAGIFYLEYKSFHGNKYYSYVYLKNCGSGKWCEVYKRAAKRKRFWQSIKKILKEVIENDIDFFNDIKMESEI